MSSPMTTKQMALRVVAAVSGAALLAYLIWRVGPGDLLREHLHVRLGTWL